MILYSNFPIIRQKKTYLHSNDGVDEEEHGDKQANVRQGFKTLNERPKQYPYSVPLSQQFYQTCRTKQAQKSHVDEVLL